MEATPEHVSKLAWNIAAPARCSKPVIVAGDFNTFWGTHEIYLFMRAAGLRSANVQGLPSYPARNPRVASSAAIATDTVESQHGTRGGFGRPFFFSARATS